MTGPATTPDPQPPTAGSPLFHSLRVRAVERDADDAAIVSFEVPGELSDIYSYRPGQFLTLRHELDGVELRRSYSLCDWGEAGLLRVGVRYVPGGAFTTWLHETLQPGDMLDVMAPDGHFCLPGRDSRRLSLDAEGQAPPAPTQSHYLGIAGGSGITPFIALLKATLADDPACSWTLIYGNRHVRSAMFREELEDLKNRYMTRLDLHFVFSREHTDVPLYSGRMTREKLAEFLGTVVDPSAVDHAFISGPFAVNDEAEAALLAAGVPEERLHIERFGVPLPADGSPLAQQALEGDAPEAQITVIRDGVSREVAFRSGDPSILEAARQAGLEMPFSCTSGVCSTCRAKLLEGQVRMDRCFALEKRDIAAGFILTCQAHPLTERVVLSFDER